MTLVMDVDDGSHPQNCFWCRDFLCTQSITKAFKCVPLTGHVRKGNVDMLASKPATACMYHVRLFAFCTVPFAGVLAELPTGVDGMSPSFYLGTSYD